jgi:glycosyltransferase involved in cell wall biosynthesis
VPVISTYIKDYVKELGVPESKTFFHPNFVDEELFKPSEDKAMKSIICVCRLERWKHPEKILEAMPYILEKHPGTMLHFAGTGSMLKEMEQKAKELKIINDVHFMGNVNHNKFLPKFMPCCTVFACGIAGFSLMEALACGLPVVVGNYEWAGEVIKDYENGFLVQNIEDEKEYAEKINKILDNQLSQKIMGQNNRWLAIERFSKKAFQQRELEIYKKVVK